MQLTVVLAACVTFCISSPCDKVPGDNSDYVEGRSRYIWMPDGDGKPHRVDLRKRPGDAVMIRNSDSGAKNQYWLYTRKNPKSFQLLNHGDLDSVRSSNYAANRPLNVIVHGWNSNGDSEINPMITKAFLSAQDCNVIVVDWSSLSSYSYWSTVLAVPSIGEHIGDFLVWLIDTAGGNWNQVHIVGYSLGAHIIGNAGRRAGSRPARITGLDPAGPKWYDNSNALRASDGQYVECIHVDGGQLGIFEPICTANFYPNGGKNPQPGCWISICSHSRSYELFASSVLHNHFPGRRCSDLEEAEENTCSGSVLKMGNSILTKRGAGLYGLHTNWSWPF